MLLYTGCNIRLNKNPIETHSDCKFYTEEVVREQKTVVKNKLFIVVFTYAEDEAKS